MALEHFINLAHNLTVGESPGNYSLAILFFPASLLLFKCVWKPLSNVHGLLYLIIMVEGKPEPPNVRPHVLGSDRHTSDTLSNLNALISDLISTYGGIRDIGIGTLAQRPSAGTAGRFWWATDDQRLYADNGSSWDTIDADAIAHASTHENGGSDELDVTGLSGLLSDSQNPTNHATDHGDGGSDEITITENQISDLDHDADKIKGTDVSAVSPSDGEALIYNSVSGYWEPMTVGTASGGDHNTLTDRDVANCHPEDSIDFDNVAGHTHDGTDSTVIEYSDIANRDVVDADVNATAAILESKLAFDSAAGHDHDGVNSKQVDYSDLTSIPSEFTPLNHDIESKHTGQLPESRTDFDNTSGHDHDGTDSKKVDFSNLDNIPSDFNPEIHASEHENGGIDEISVTGLFGVLADDQPPQAHDINGIKHTGTLSESKVNFDGTGGHDHDGTNSKKVSYSDIDSKPATFPPDSHEFAGTTHSANTLAQVNSKISDATLIDTNDSRLSDDRDPNTHTWDKHTSVTRKLIIPLIREETLGAGEPGLRRDSYNYSAWEYGYNALGPYETLAGYFKVPADLDNTQPVTLFVGYDCPNSSWAGPGAGIQVGLFGMTSKFALSIDGFPQTTTEVEEATTSGTGSLTPGESAIVFILEDITPMPTDDLFIRYVGIEYTAKNG